jgi:hypothetical protein
MQTVISSEMNGFAENALIPRASIVRIHSDTADKHTNLLVMQQPRFHGYHTDGRLVRWDPLSKIQK